MKDKIIIINMARGFGGGEVQTANLIKGLQEEFDVFCFCRKNKPLATYVLSQNMRVSMIHSLWHLLYLVYSAKKITIHAQDGKGAHIAALASSINRQSKCIITRHVNFPLKRKLSRLSYQSADWLIGVSQQICDNLRAYNASVKLIYAGINKPKQSAAFSSQLPKHRLSVCHIGNLQKVKNFPLTIDLARKCEHLGLDIHFFLVGDGEMQEVLHQQAKGLTNLSFLAKTSYIGSIFEHCDIQIIPSQNEGLSLVLLEGYQYLVPCLANNVGGMKELVEQGKTGFLIQNNNIDDYMERLLAFYEHPELLHTMQKHIKEYNIQHDYSMNNMITQHIELYRALF